jgi:hypothetical protein
MAFGAEDTTPPVLKGFTISPAVIDTSAGPAEVILGFAVTDDASGVSYLEATFTDPSGALPKSTSFKFAPTLSGSPAAKLIFPRFSAPGVWVLSKVFLSDAAGNTLLLDTDAVEGLGFPTRLEVRSTKDTTSPKLSRLEFTPPRIDTTVGPADVTLSFTATDDLAGVSYLELVFISPAGTYRHGGPSKFEPTRSVSGAMTVTFPRRSQAGQWKLNSVFLADAAGNTQILNTDDLSGLGIQTALEVICEPDNEPPTLASLRFTPESIDTSAGPATVRVAFRATDIMSGIKSIEVVFSSPSANTKQTASAIFPSLNGVSDSLKVTFPRFSESGQWTLSSAFLADAAGNTLVLDVDELIRRGIPTTLEVKGAQDTAPPHLTALRFTPEEIDTSRGPAAVEVAISATDDLAGVQSAEVVFVNPSESTHQQGSVSIQAQTQVSAKIRVDFPSRSEPGEWRIESLALTDAAGNTVVLDADALSSRVGKLRVR